MDIISLTNQTFLTDNHVATIGMFDGVHLAHQMILKQVADTARHLRKKSMLITFEPHPRSVLTPQSPVLLITHTQEKISYTQHLGIDRIVIIPFTYAFSQIEAYDFVQNILKKQLNVSQLVIGYDHHFGKNRQGNLPYLIQNQNIFDLNVIEIPRQMIDARTISSTEIKKFLAEGNTREASRLLGRPYRLDGRVIHGQKLGKKIGYPTANIRVKHPEKIIPQPGVYAVRIALPYKENSPYNAMLNMGYRPTLNGENFTIETHIFDFDKDIYDEEVIVYFYGKLRNENKFETLEQLKNQLDADKKNAISALKHV